MAEFQRRYETELALARISADVAAGRLELRLQGRCLVTFRAMPSTNTVAGCSYCVALKGGGCQRCSQFREQITGADTLLMLARWVMKRSERRIAKGLYGIIDMPNHGVLALFSTQSRNDKRGRGLLATDNTVIIYCKDSGRCDESSIGKWVAPSFQWIRDYPCPLQKASSGRHNTLPHLTYTAFSSRPNTLREPPIFISIERTLR
jgi:hypothetical protein